MANRPYFNLLPQESPLAVSKRLRHEIFRRDNHTCQSCGAKAPDVKLEPDHVVPVALGGPDDPSNLRTLCTDCNAGKSATPPDAATVAKVADDAARWSQAIQAAADHMLGDTKVRDEARAAFDARWRAWSEGRPALPRPMGWEMSVDQFLKAGLPLSALLDCIDIAMRSRHVKPDGLFKYMCGAAWKEVAKIQRAAKALVSEAKPPQPSHAEPGPPEPDGFQDGQYDLAASLLEDLDEDVQEKYRAYAKEWGEYPEDPIECEIDAAKYAFIETRHDLERAHDALEHLLALFPEDVVVACRDFAKDEFRAHAGEEPEGLDVLVHTVREMARRRRFDEARAYLDHLPSAERDEWVACATTLLGSSDDPSHLISIEVKAAEYAQKHKATGGVLGDLCGGRGDHGAMCPRLAEYFMSLKDCVGCGAECEGRHRACASHLERIMDGQVASKSTGVTLVVLNFEEIPPRDPREPPF